MLDPERRRQWDESLAARAGQDALEEFIKFIGFSIKGGVLPSEAEANLVEFGRNSGVPDELIKSSIDQELKRKGARRSTLVAAPPPVSQAASSSRVASSG